jgi:hypothetical protein
MSKTKWEEYQEKLAKKQEDIRLLAIEKENSIEEDIEDIVIEEKAVKPWDFLNPNTEYADDALANGRYQICKGCPELIKLTKQCKKCGCFMAAKTKLAQASCPIGRW